MLGKKTSLWQRERRVNLTTLPFEQHIRCLLLLVHAREGNRQERWCGRVSREEGQRRSCYPGWLSMPWARRALMLRRDDDRGSYVPVTVSPNGNHNKISDGDVLGLAHESWQK